MMRRDSRSPTGFTEHEMSALAAAAPILDDQPVEMSWGAMRLSGLLAATADRHTRRIALKDQSNREDWSGRPPIEWTYPFAYDVIERLAHFLLQLGLPPKAPVGICLPNGSEACLTILAVDHAGFVPCLLPVAWSEDDLAAAVEAANISTVITQGVVGDERPAEVFCRLAARYFGLRFVCSFGPLVPDGVADLDRVILGAESPKAGPVPPAEPASDNGIVTFLRQGKALKPIFRPCRSVVAAAVTFLVAAKIRPGQRIVSLLAPDDHCGLTVGLIASLLSGATLECHGLFSARAFMDALKDETLTHLVVPAWMEASLAKAALPKSIVSVILAHEAPTRFKAKTALRGSVIDVLAFGELALIAAQRKGAGQFSLSLEDDGEPRNATSRHLLRVRRGEDGAIAFGGVAADIRDFERGSPTGLAPLPEWRPSGYKAELFAGILIGVSEQD
jgi:mycobactin salicyl-AMP ligase